MQQRICDCWLDVGACFCSLDKTDEQILQVTTEVNGEAEKADTCGKNIK
jgi:hypothetical protein